MGPNRKFAGAAFSLALIFSTAAARAEDGISTVIPGWLIKSTPLDSFTFGIEHTEGSAHDKSAYLEMKVADPTANGILWQKILAEPYRGKRMRVSARVKTANAVGAQLFMRIDDAHDKRLTYDNMEMHTINGTTEWTRYAAVLDVPQDGQIIQFGIYVNGANGAEKVWADDFKLEEVSKDVALTALDHPLPKAPVNTAFTGMTGWLVTGRGPRANFDFGTEEVKGIRIRTSGFIASKMPNPTGFEDLVQSVSPNAYRGKRVQLSAWMKSLDAANAQLWMTVDGPEGKTLSFDNLDSRPLIGTTDWKRYEIVLDVPQESVEIDFGFFLNSWEKPGKVWATDFRLEPVGNDVAVTHFHSEMPKAPENMNFDQ